MKQRSKYYLFLTTMALVPWQIQAYYGYPSERSRDQSEEGNRRDDRDSQNQNYQYYDNGNASYQGSSSSNLQGRDLDKRSRSYRGDRDLSQNDDSYQPRKDPEVPDDSRDFEIRHEDYRDRLYYEEHKEEDNRKGQVADGSRQETKSKDQQETNKNKENENPAAYR